MNHDAGMLYGGRVICGLAAGICSAAVPCYVGDYFNKHADSQRQFLN